MIQIEVLKELGKRIAIVIIQFAIYQFINRKRKGKNL